MKNASLFKPKGIFLCDVSTALLKRNNFNSNDLVTDIIHIDIGVRKPLFLSYESLLFADLFLRNNT